MRREAQTRVCLDERLQVRRVHRDAAGAGDERQEALDHRDGLEWRGDEKSVRGSVSQCAEVKLAIALTRRTRRRRARAVSARAPRRARAACADAACRARRAACQRASSSPRRPPTARPLADRQQLSVLSTSATLTRAPSPLSRCPVDGPEHGLDVLRRQVHVHEELERRRRVVLVDDEDAALA